MSAVVDRRIDIGLKISSDSKKVLNALRKNVGNFHSKNYEIVEINGNDYLIGPLVMLKPFFTRSELTKDFIDYDVGMLEVVNKGQSFRRKIDFSSIGVDQAGEIYIDVFDYFKLPQQTEVRGLIVILKNSGFASMIHKIQLLIVPTKDFDEINFEIDPYLVGDREPFDLQCKYIKEIRDLVGQWLFDTVLETILIDLGVYKCLTYESRKDIKNNLYKIGCKHIREKLPRDM